MKITPVRDCSDGGEIVRIGLVGQPLVLSLPIFHAPLPGIRGLSTTTGILRRQVSRTPGCRAARRIAFRSEYLRSVCLPLSVLPRPRASGCTPYCVSARIPPSGMPCRRSFVCVPCTVSRIVLNSSVRYALPPFVRPRPVHRFTYRAECLRPVCLPVSVLPRPRASGRTPYCVSARIPPSGMPSAVGSPEAPDAGPQAVLRFGPNTSVRYALPPFVRPRPVHRLTYRAEFLRPVCLPVSVLPRPRASGRMPLSMPKIRSAVGAGFAVSGKCERGCPTSRRQPLFHSNFLRICDPPEVENLDGQPLRPGSFAFANMPARTHPPFVSAESAGRVQPFFARAATAERYSRAETRYGRTGPGMRPSCAVSRAGP